MMNENSLPRSGGYQHPRCYARGDANCSTKISKEHFISKTLLERIHRDNTAKIAGLAWQAPETFQRVPIKGLASKILCERHNSALSGLDAAFGAFTQAIRDFDRAKTKERTKEKFSGNDIERWTLKCLIGLTASGNLKSGLKPECVDLLFKRRTWPEGWGLYFANVGSTPIYHTDSFAMETLIGPDRKIVLAAKFHIQGLPFILVLGTPGDAKSFGIRHPCEIVLRSAIGERRLRLSWEDGQPGDSVQLTRAGEVTTAIRRVGRNGREKASLSSDGSCGLRREERDKFVRQPLIGRRALFGGKCARSHRAKVEPAFVGFLDDVGE